MKRGARSGCDCCTTILLRVRRERILVFFFLCRVEVNLVNLRLFLVEEEEEEEDEEEEEEVFVLFFLCLFKVLLVNLCFFSVEEEVEKSILTM